MDINGINFHLFTGSDSVNLENMTAVEDDWNTLFINYAAIAWHEMRRAWIGDQSVASQRKPRESIIRHWIVISYSYSLLQIMFHLMFQ
ncbi:hypothetical protein ACS0TY_015850 [Phlomoides rotata]